MIMTDTRGLQADPLWCIDLSGDGLRAPREPRARIFLIASNGRLARSSGQDRPQSLSGRSEGRVGMGTTLRQAVGFPGLCRIVVELEEKLTNFEVELLGGLHAADMTDSRHDDKL